MNRTYRWMIPAALLLGFGLACGGLDAPEEETITIVPDDPVVAAYLADCGHTFSVDAGDPGMAEGADNECTFVEFEQNCAPDSFGCWDKGQQCISECGAPCVDCQSACASTCESCKSQCGGDATCQVNCASARATCRTTCMTGLETCKTDTCREVESACYREGQALMKTNCPGCQAYKSCLEDVWFRGKGEAEDCNPKLTSTDERCKQWCVPEP